MAKKDLSSVNTDLSALARGMPTQKPPVEAGSKLPVIPGEPTSQFTLKMRASLHKELARLAFEKDMTMRGFIMEALKGRGLNVTEDDLIDRRRREANETD